MTIRLWESTTIGLWEERERGEREGWAKQEMIGSINNQLLYSLRSWTASANRAYKTGSKIPVPLWDWKRLVRRWWGETTSVMAGVESHYRETQRPDLFLRRNGGVSREKVQRDTLSLHVGVFLWTSAAWNARNMSPWENAALEDADLLYIHRKYQYRRGQLWNHWTEKSTTEQPCTLVVQPCTLVVQPCTLVVQPCTLVVQPCTLVVQPCTAHWWYFIERTKQMWEVVTGGRGQLIQGELQHTTESAQINSFKKLMGACWDRGCYRIHPLHRKYYLHQYQRRVDMAKRTYRAARPLSWAVPLHVWGEDVKVKRVNSSLQIFSQGGTQTLYLGCLKQIRV